MFQDSANGWFTQPLNLPARADHLKSKLVPECCIDVHCWNEVQFEFPSHLRFAPQPTTTHLSRKHDCVLDILGLA